MSKEYVSEEDAKKYFDSAIKHLKMYDEKFIGTQSIKKNDFVKIKNDTENAVYQVVSDVMYPSNHIDVPFFKLSNDEYVLLSDLILFNPKGD